MPLWIRPYRRFLLQCVALYSTGFLHGQGPGRNVSCHGWWVRMRGPAIDTMNMSGIVLLSLPLTLVSCGGGGESQRAPLPPTVAEITVFPSVASLSVGQRQQYTTVVKDTNGNVLHEIAVIWSTSQADVATIDDAGSAQAVAGGVTTVTATRDGVSSQLVTLTVNPVPPVVPPGDSRATLPPWLTYCDNTLCQSLPQVVVAVCSGGNLSCNPSRFTTVIPQVNGFPVSGIVFPLLNTFSDTTVRLRSGDGAVFSLFVESFTASSVKLEDDRDLLVSYYGVTPVWSGTTTLNFTTTTLTSSLADSVFFQHRSYHSGDAAATLHVRLQTVITTEQRMTGIVPASHVTAYLLPTELASATRLGEGNFSFGNGTITINYGNPPYLAASGGFECVVVPELAHEYAHELFHEISARFLDNPSCLNEGIANAVAVTAGFAATAKLGPIGLRGLDFTKGCVSQTELHDIGDCYLWHIYMVGLLNPSFVFGLFHPQHTFVFDSCVMNMETGNSLLVYFTESANGANLLPVLDAMQIPHAVSYSAAKVALGL